MQRKALSEACALRLVNAHAAQFAVTLKLHCNCAVVDSPLTARSAVEAAGFTASSRLVCKPELSSLDSREMIMPSMTLLDGTIDEVCAFAATNLGRAATLDGHMGRVERLLVQEFFPHAEPEELNLSVCAPRVCTRVSLSCGNAGNAEATIEIDPDAQLSIDCAASDLVKGRLGSAVTNDAAALFVVACQRMFEDLDLVRLDVRNFVVLPDGTVCPLSVRCVVDWKAYHRATPKWGNIEIAVPWGYVRSAEMTAVAEMDDRSRAGHFAFRVCNPEGRIWVIAAGNGAAHIIGDAICQLGAVDEIANFCEYSGQPTSDESLILMRAVIQAARHSKRRGRVFLIGGCIANYTDVFLTFKGFVHAIRESVDALREMEAKIVVRRGGPSYQEALKAINDVCAELGVPSVVYGPDVDIATTAHIAVGHLASIDKSVGAERSS